MTDLSPLDRLFDREIRLSQAERHLLNQARQIAATSPHHAAQLRQQARDLRRKRVRLAERAQRR